MILVLGLCLGIEKTVGHESDGDSNCNWCSWYSQRIGIQTGRLGNKRTSVDHLKYSIIKIVQNTEQSPWDFKRLTVTQTPTRNHRLMPAWKTLKRSKIIITNKWYMLNPESALDNETHKLLCDFEIKTHHLISARRPDILIVTKKKERTCWMVDFVISTNYKWKLKESETSDKYLDLAREIKKYGTRNWRWYQL